MCSIEVQTGVESTEDRRANTCSIDNNSNETCGQNDILRCTRVEKNMLYTVITSGGSYKVN
jgi:hypothetical protein